VSSLDRRPDRIGEFGDKSIVVRQMVWLGIEDGAEQYNSVLN
jgi:hypothetical protein